MTKLPFEYKKYERKNGTVDFSIRDARLYEYLFQLGSSGEKFIPEEIKQASPDLLKILFEWFQLGDGRNVKTEKSNKQSVFTTSKQLIYDLHDILIKSGGYGTITEYQPKNRIIYDTSFIEKEIENEDGTLSLVKEKIKRLIKSSGSKTQYNLNISNTNHIWLDKRTIKITPIEYDGMVSCVTVPNQNFYVMKNGKAHWTGNSSVVSLNNIAHRITKMWWGNDENQNILYGTIEIITTPGYHKMGICSMVGDKICEYLKRRIRLGISSRGVGTLKSIAGENIVQKDFELIGFDLVHSPSTPGAYLFPVNEPTQIGENNVKNEGLIITERYKKIMNKMDRFML